MSVECVEIVLDVEKVLWGGFEVALERLFALSDHCGRSLAEDESMRLDIIAVGVEGT